MNKVKERNNNVVIKAYKKLVVPGIAAKLCGAMIVFVDSLITAKYINIGAVSAIALVSPIISFDNALFSYLCSGTTSVMIKYRSSGRIRESNRAFAAILSNVFLWYIVIWWSSVFYMRDIFMLFTSDTEFISDAMNYFIPIAVFEPFNVTLMCFERGLITEGNTGYFGFRCVITTVLNIIFSLIAVLEFNAGILGVSMASNLADLLGYCWIFPYYFSKRCTIRPDFSVLADKKEAVGYVKEETRIGSVYALNTGMNAVSDVLLNKAVILTGGNMALAAIGIYNSIARIIKAFTSTVQATGYNLCNLFYSDRDFEGARFSFRSTLLNEAVVSVVFWMILNIFSQQIAGLFHVDSPEVLSALQACFCFYTIAAAASVYSDFFGSVTVVMNKLKAARLFNISISIVTIVSVMIGMTGISFSQLLIILAASSTLVAVLEVLWIRFSGSNLWNANRNEICSFSYNLDESICAIISEKTCEILQKIPSCSSIALKAALVVEECNRVILYVNRNKKKEVSVDFKITADEEQCIFTLIDTGRPFDPIHMFKEKQLSGEYALSTRVLISFSSDPSFCRVVNLNISRVVIPLKNKSCLSENESDTMPQPYNTKTDKDKTGESRSALKKQGKKNRIFRLK